MFGAERDWRFGLSLGNGIPGRRHKRPEAWNQFANAVPVLEDEFAITLEALARSLTVVYSWRGDTVSVISARPATAKEQRQYLENS